MAGLAEFKALLAQDAAFAEEARKCKSFDDLVAFAGARGFTFTDEEVETLTDLAAKELSKAAGGVNALVSAARGALIPST